MSDEICLNLTGVDPDEVVETPDYLRGLSIFNVCLSLVFFPTCWLVFVYYRPKYENLRKRNLTMLTLFAFSAAFFCVQVSVVNIVGNENYNCHFFILFGLYTFVFNILAYFLRLVSLYWRIRFSQGLIEAKFSQLQRRGFIYSLENSNDLTGVQEPLPSEKQRVKFAGIKEFVMKLYCWKSSKGVPESLHFTHFLSSKHFTLVTFIVVNTLVLSVSTIAHFKFQIPADVTCFNCAGRESNLAFVPLNVGITGFFAFVLFKMRKYPDSLGVKKELYVFAGVLLVFHVVCILFPRYFFFEEADRNRDFDFTIPKIYEFMVVIYYSFPHQVWLAAKRGKRHLVFETTLKDFIQTDEGTKVFLLYLATRLSSENLLFYKAVDQWKAQYNDSTEEENKTKALRIYDFFFIEDDKSFFTINISGFMKRAILEEINNNPSATVFDNAQADVYNLICGEVFLEFYNSSYYAAYMNALGQANVKDFEQHSTLGTVL